MPTYRIEFRWGARALIDVEAASEKEAIEKAREDGKPWASAEEDHAARTRVRVVQRIRKSKRR